MTGSIVNYDADGYDYRRYWTGRDYERWAERRALRRSVPKLGKPAWFIDLGGGFGRNAEHYRQRAEHYVLADYSATNLRNAAELLADDLAAGRAFLVRCDLNALPFTDGAFDAGMSVRVLHHLSDIDHALSEMGRTITGRWLLDVPIKHHAFAMIRGAVRGRWSETRGPKPLRTGTSAEPFWNYQLAAIRQTLAREGWRTSLVASVNNLRRWDRRLPKPLAWAGRPLVRVLEVAAQNGGRGWWGPSQFVLARRAAAPVAAEMPVAPNAPVTPVVAGPSEQSPIGVPAFATRLRCPACQSALRWTSAEAICAGCGHSYRKSNDYWDFTVAAATAAPLSPDVSPEAEWRDAA